MRSRGLRPLKPPFAVIINPTAAGGRSLKVWQAMQLAVPHHISASEADFRSTVRTYSKKFKTIGICGGDSSLTIAAEELATVKFKGELRFLPAGSVNDIVLDIAGQSRDKKAPVYLGQLTAGDAFKTFIGQANWGLGVVVNRWVGKILHTFRFLRPLQNAIGTLCIIVAHFLHRETVNLEIRAGKRVLSGKFSIVVVSQIRHWASGLLFCPDAGYRIPEFQIVAVRRCGLIRLIRIILAAKTGGHLAYAEVETLQADLVSVKSHQFLSVQIDGDILRAGAKDIQSQSFSLKKKKSALRLTL